MTAAGGGSSHGKLRGVTGSSGGKQLVVSRAQADAADVDLGALSRLADVDVRISLEWGRSRITVQEALELDDGSLLRLDQHADDPVDIRVNGKLFGRGRLVVTGAVYGVQLTEVVDSE